MDWLTRAIRNTWLSLSVVPTISRTREVAELLKERGVRKAVSEPPFTGPDRTIFLEKFNKRLIQQ